MDSCSNMSHSAYQECLNSSVETVGDWSRGYFKNEACALCNGVTLFIKDGVRSTKHCFEPGLPSQVTIVFEPNHRQTTNESTDTQVVERQCPRGLVCDDTLGFCREGVVTNTDDALSYVFLITLWFEPGVSRHMIFDPVTNRPLL